jgi:hypothetical protein
VSAWPALLNVRIETTVPAMHTRNRGEREVREAPVVQPV